MRKHSLIIRKVTFPVYLASLHLSQLANRDVLFSFVEREAAGSLCSFIRCPMRVPSGFLLNDTTRQTLFRERGSPDRVPAGDVTGMFDCYHPNGICDRLVFQRVLF